MTREEVQQALAKTNETIAQLEAKLHPPPLVPAERNELEAELAAAEQAREALEQTLNNLPDAAPTGEN